MKNTTDLTASNNITDSSKTTLQNVEFALHTLVSVLTVLFNLVLVVVLVRLKSSHLNCSTRSLLIYGAISQMCVALIMLARELFPCFMFGVIAVYFGTMVISGYFLLAVDSYITISRPYTYKFIMTPCVTKAAILMACLFWAGLLLMSYLLGSPIVSQATNFCTVNDGNLSPQALATIVVATVVTLLLTMSISAWNIRLLKKISSRVGPQVQSAQNASTSAPSAQGLNVSNQPVVSSNCAIFSISETTKGPSVSIKVNTNRKNKSTRQGRLIRLLMASLLMTSLCWPPVLVTTTIAGIYDTYNIDRTVLDSIKIRLAPLISVDGIMHPIIAVVLSSEIRSAVWLLLPCKRKGAPQSQ